MKNYNSREAAYLAVLASLRHEQYVRDFLEQWRKECNPSQSDLSLAQEIANGTVRMALALDCLGEQLTENGRLSLKVKERALLRTAIYQFFYLSRIPLYALTNETMKLAKKYCHPTFCAFLNALLRKLEGSSLALPDHFSIRYSYPTFFVDALIEDYGKEQTESILEAGNRPSPTLFRMRSCASDFSELGKGVKELTKGETPFGVVLDSSILPVLTKRTDLYIQNITPNQLIVHLSQHLPKPPQSILDLCAAPGGKLLAAHDLFPHAQLWANDLSPEKTLKLKENCNKYGLNVVLSEGKGEDFNTEQLFDLVILDVPCSNSGVLNKRPEARWRLSQETLTQLKEIQLALIHRATQLLRDDGQIWYLTCSILKEENENIIEEACLRWGLNRQFHETILPNIEGWDGGFGCVLKVGKAN
jgi:16S rRNA (cytosine967-C5)-methyltransferase